MLASGTDTAAASAVFPMLLLSQVVFKVYEAQELKPYLDAANAEKEAASA